MISIVATSTFMEGVSRVPWDRIDEICETPAVNVSAGFDLGRAGVKGRNVCAEMRFNGCESFQPGLFSTLRVSAGIRVRV